MTLHQSGQLSEAETHYRGLLKAAPLDTRLLCMLGVLLGQTGRAKDGLVLLEKSARLAPRDLDIQFNLALALEHSGQLERAIGIYQSILKLGWDDADIHGQLGRLLYATGDLTQTIEHCRVAISLNPQDYQWHELLAMAQNRIGNHAEAINSYRIAVRLRPDGADLYYNLGIALRAAGRLAEAIAAFSRADAIQFNTADFLNALGDALRENGQPEEALTVLQRALALDHEHIGVQVNLANVLVDLDRVEESFPHYLKALSLRSDDADIHGNLAIALDTVGRFDEALQEYRSALRYNPEHPDARFCFALHHLAKGEFATGWPEYEWRWRSKSLGIPQRIFPQPVWNGVSLAGKRLLIHAEQGLGDEIMFASVFPEIIAEAEHCVIECSPKLERIFRRSFPTASIVATDPRHSVRHAMSAGELAGDIPIDIQIAAGSLPLYRRRAWHEFPCHGGYLRADPQAVQAWRERLEALGAGLKIGLSWKGGTARTGILRRSFALSELAPLFQVQNIRFISLQYTECSNEIADFAHQTGNMVHHWREAIDDYDQTAALVSALDLVVSVCTSIVHLGGALGQPVWVMAPRHPEWRYGLDGEGMPWYPSVRVFRQQDPGDWGALVRKVKAELQTFIANDGNASGKGADQ